MGPYREFLKEFRENHRPSARVAQEPLEVIDQSQDIERAVALSLRETRQQRMGPRGSQLPAVVEGEPELMSAKWVQWKVASLRLENHNWSYRKAHAEATRIMNLLLVERCGSGSTGSRKRRKR